MRHAANLSLLYPQLALEDRPAAAAADGFEGVEILFPYGIDVDALRAACDAAGLQVVLINTPVGEGPERGLAAVAGAEDRFRRDFTLAVDTATRLGAGMIHTMAGVIPTGTDSGGGDPTETSGRARRTLLDNLRWAAPIAAAQGITLTLEGLNRQDFPGYHYATPAAVCDVLAALDVANVGLQFDLYHTAKEALSVGAEIEAARPWIRHVQIAGPPERHEPTAQDTELFDALAWLDRSGYDGWLGFEYRPRADTSEGLTWRQWLTP